MNYYCTSFSHKTKQNQRWCWGSGSTNMAHCRRLRHTPNTDRKLEVKITGPVRKRAGQGSDFSVAFDTQLLLNPAPGPCHVRANLRRRNFKGDYAWQDKVWGPSTRPGAVGKPGSRGPRTAPGARLRQRRSRPQAARSAWLAVLFLLHPLTSLL